MLRLSDLVAPEWTHVQNERTFRMRPLSLKSFAQAESRGVSLSRLSAPNDMQVWVELFAFLADVPYRTQNEQENLLADILTDPVAFEQFRSRVAQSFADEQDSTPEEAAKKQRRVVQKYKPEKDDTEPQDDTDYGFVVDLARTSGLSLSDFFAMSFRGLIGVEKSLERMPPQPGLGGLLG